jgi:hypothetical protein
MVVYDELDIGFQLLSELVPSLRVAVVQQQARLSIVWTVACTLALHYTISDRSAMLVDHYYVEAPKCRRRPARPGLT